MATKTIQDSSLTAVANAIRAKTGKSASMEFPTEFVSEIGNISGGGIEWVEFTAASSKTNMLDSFNLLFPDADTKTNCVFAATLKNKSIADYPNNQAFAFIRFNISAINFILQSAVRYRSGSYSTANIASNYDGIIEVGDTFDLIEVEYEVL